MPSIYVEPLVIL